MGAHLAKTRFCGRGNWIYTSSHVLGIALHLFCTWSGGDMLARLADTVLLIVG
jgi:hypothetical protein